MYITNSSSAWMDLRLRNSQSFRSPSEQNQPWASCALATSRYNAASLIASSRRRHSRAQTGVWGLQAERHQACGDELCAAPQRISLSILISLIILFLLRLFRL